MSVLLWVIAGSSLAALVYCWIGYPVLLAAFQCFYAVRIDRRPYTPLVSVVVAAYNEADNITSRIQNLLVSAYPADKLEVIIASDGSTDNTAEIARRFAAERVKVLHWPERRGRAAVHNGAVQQASGEIIVFTDAETCFERTFLAHLIQSFADPRVGCASGQLEWFQPASSAVAGGRGAYWRYEYRLREWESQAGILCLASGPCMAVRKRLYRPLASPAYDVDFMTPLDVVEAGYLVVHEPSAVAREAHFDHDSAEFRAEVRMVTRNLAGYLDRRCFVGRGVGAGLPWSLVSHKVLRWMTPFFLIALLISTGLLAGSLARILLLLQMAFYAAALLGYASRGRAEVGGILRMPYGFCLASASFLLGVVRAVGRSRITFYDKAGSTAHL